MNHWIIAPVLLPPLVGAVIILAARYQVALQRVFSVASTVALAGIAIGLLVQSMSGQIGVYELGNWPAPFGIVLVLDRLTATMVTLTALLGVAVVLYAIGSGWDKRGNHFHALFQFQLMGIFGAFLTGDVFNLFVFFEVLLIASYGLMIHGGGAVRLRAGVQYVVYNLLGSTLFLFALGTIYAVTGTLNMADLALRVAELPADDTAMIRVAAILLLLVFAVKAALIPLHFWLPATYAEAPAPVAALFAVMTKIGAYAIIRIYTLVFGPEVAATADIIGPWLMPAALVTLAIGMLGVLGATHLGRLAAFAAIGSMGTLLIAIAPFTPQATTAALYYMIHSTLAGAALFLVVDMVRARRQAEDDAIAPRAVIAQNGLIAAYFFAAAIATAGMPPLSGFLGKLLVLDALRGHDLVWLIWATILVTSLVAVVGFARAGSMVFWKVEPAPEVDSAAAPPAALPFVATGSLIAGIVALTVFAGPVTAFLSDTSEQVFDKQAYIDAVMDTPRAQEAEAANAAGKPLAYYGNTEGSADKADAESTTDSQQEKTE
ncbi:monovalent cation/H+ antiporter subunit D [Seohaeicola sp. SP36]|uniref:monovalent cation/H+ antiporter subunit D n=1 Tax=unclassified Seohaeicola TaxID=2641111 RepID=UPI00237C124E|nr:MULTISPECIES: monovalent cation/H+ antiporter subunit D [unclassified Seohaeicola]MDD9707655.1 monovalent cation/H+ antiporter subunit D [Seohaeicola sp. 4SK31]MDD9735896.1 monovalent cation/H+ antiporter subunit D [Seohaeicola sp. SP36]